MKIGLLVVTLAASGCAGGLVEGRLARAPRGSWGTGDQEGPVRYLDWSVGAGRSLKRWKDAFVDENQWLLAYEITFVYHFAYSWNLEFATWTGQFKHPLDYYRIRSFVHTMSLHRTQPAGLGWWHVSVGAGWCDNGGVEAKGAVGLKIAAGLTYPIAEPVNVGIGLGCIVNETHFVHEWQGDELSLSVLSVTVSLAVSC